MRRIRGAYGDARAGGSAATARARPRSIVPVPRCMIGGLLWGRGAKIPALGAPTGVVRWASCPKCGTKGIRCKAKGIPCGTPSVGGTLPPSGIGPRGVRRALHRVGDGARPVGNEQFLIRNGVQGIRNGAFPIGGGTPPMGNGAFPIGCGVPQMGNGAFPIRNGAFLIGSGAFRIGWEAILIRNSSSPARRSFPANGSKAPGRPGTRFLADCGARIARSGSEM